jgi:SAM-dependent methyltransferase
VPSEFEWDKTLYAGSAAYYATGRVPYPAELAEVMTARLSLDGSGRLLDCGCGPGSLTLLLAPLFSEAVGIDADPDMIARASAEAERAGRNASPRPSGDDPPSMTACGASSASNVRFRHMRAETLPGGLGTFRLVTFAQSFHWVDQPRVARAARAMLEPDGAFALVHATTHEGLAGDDPLPRPRPPRQRIGELVARYLGPVRRAGRGVIPDGPPSGEDAILRGAGFRGPDRVEVGGGAIAGRTEDQVVASVFSLSSAAPHLFGERMGAFEQELRGLLRQASPSGQFSERMRGIAVDVWRPR